MKAYLPLLLLAAVVSSCAKDDVAEGSGPRVFRTGMEPVADTRTHLNESLLNRWDADDRVSVFAGNTVNQQYRFDGATGADGGTFTRVGSSSSSSVSTLPVNISVYPYQNTTSVSEDGTITFDFPSVQQYAQGSFGLEANTMVAVTKDTDDDYLYFRNTCGYLRISLYGNATITSMTLQGNAGEGICGVGSISASHSAVPVATLSASAMDVITIDCGEGVRLGTTAETATTFYFVVPPVEFTRGITVRAFSADGKVFEKSTDRSVSIFRNMIHAMAAVEYEGVSSSEAYGGALSFTAVEASSIALNKVESPAAVSLEYRLNEASWTTYTIGRTITLASGDIVRFRAGERGNQTFSEDYENYYNFSMEGKIKAGGNIMSLLDRDLEANSVPPFAFYSLFDSCSSLLTAPSLPARELDEECYEYMFYNCTGLTSAPTLPARTLASGCYSDMFAGCSSLTSAPALPAENLASECYKYMFSDCTGLTSAPALPATSLFDECYSNMFSGCTSLAVAPSLPAEDLGLACYYCMFDGCTGLTSAPVLPSKTLKQECYSNMFSGCTGLKTAPALPAEKLDEYCYDSMFRGCTSLTSAPALPAQTLAASCYLSMFSDCTSLTSAPVLPAKTLKESCYHSMFSGCTNLRTAPDLPAKTLVQYCYWHMFYGCSKLNHVKMLADDVSASSCMTYWLRGVSSTGTFEKSASAKWNISGMSGIPSGWTVNLVSE